MADPLENYELCQLNVAGQTIKLLCTAQYPVTPYTEFLIDNLPEVHAQRVLDLGAGSGAVAIAAALSGATTVTACDIDPLALAIVQANARNLKCRQIETLLVDSTTVPELFGQYFDTILCNPASLPTPSAQDPFWSGGQYGIDMISELIEIASNHLESSGRLVFIHTSLASLHRTLERLNAAKLAAGIVATRFVPFRIHYSKLSPYFSKLRAEGEIYFDVLGGKTCEILYLIQAKNFSKSQQ